MEKWLQRMCRENQDLVGMRSSLLKQLSRNEVYGRPFTEIEKTMIKDQLSALEVYKNCLQKRIDYYLED